MLLVIQLLEVFVALLLATTVSPFPSGAPLSACSHLMPIHENATVQTTAPPFLILLSETNYTTHQPIKVAVTSGEPYLAFMLQGRTRDNRPVGHFSVAPPVAKFLSCYADDDTLSHSAAFGRTAMEVMWHPPAQDEGDIIITGSIARTKYIFWAVESQPIKGMKQSIQKPVSGQSVSGQSASGQGLSGSVDTISASVMLTGCLILLSISFH